ncbi:ankyrin repeat domain-containing protein [Flavobacterium sp.]|uniref:ankyrin repeat domain-containing protein n=1 Tax=Flavobacterium sp. TaxID=239 RepID=UPI0025C337F6|nr:ankyrin repeat domain-containing protein [Flavobacterium sp.]MBA4154985.1 ankyrin repeat domain-containing protein [Flavobacterium sp.]
MKKSVIYLGIALLGFGTFANAFNGSEKTPTKEVGIYAKYYATPLCVAISKGEVEVVRKFIEYGANVNEKTNGLTPLMYAARYNQVEIIKILLEKGADAKVKDDKGFTALDHAENSKATEAVAILKNYLNS